MSQNTSTLFSDILEFTKISRWLTPINLEEERERFLKNSESEPIFIYPKTPINEIEKYLKLLESVKPKSDEPFGEWIIRRRKKELTLKLRLIGSVGKKDINEISKELYDCDFKRTYIESAQKDSQIEVDFGECDNATVADIVKAYKKTLSDYQITDWEVIPTDLSDFYVRIEPKNKRILVGKRVNWDFCDLDCSIAHEIDGHVVRAVNMHKQKKEIFQKPTPFYINTEEGLASFLGDYCSKTSQVARKHHAIKYLGGFLALKGGFFDIYKYFLGNGFSPDLSFQRTFRLKRGFSDTSKAGVFAREAMYYSAMMDVKNYLDGGGNVEKLYSGKIGFEDFDHIEVPEDIIIPQRLQDYLDNN